MNVTTKGVLRRWPELLIVAAFVAGTVAFSNPLSGLVAAMFSFPVAGVGLIVRGRRERRKQPAPSEGWRHRDADQFFTAIAREELRLLKRWPLLRLSPAAGIVAIAVLWRFVGLDYAIAAGLAFSAVPVAAYALARLRP
jgi:hypothetical protein